MCYPNSREKMRLLGHIGGDIPGTCSSLAPPLFLRRRTGLHSQPEGYGVPLRGHDKIAPAKPDPFPPLKQRWHQGEGAHAGLSTPSYSPREHIMGTRGNRLCCFPVFILKPVPPSHRLRADSHTKAVTARTNVTHQSVVGMTFPN
jgi:hypothetical protein